LAGKAVHPHDGRGGPADKADETASARVATVADGLDWKYAPAPESRDIVSIAAEYGLFIAGEFAPAADGRTFVTVNPATEEPLARVAEAGTADVDRAVAAARTAYEQAWGPMPGAERAKYLYRIARILAERSREFAVLESIDNGKPIKETRDVDIPLAAAHFFYYAGWADKLG
jgi:aldehyde dehydrogenase (NAD+)